jgi:hypothetical protein
MERAAVQSAPAYFYKRSPQHQRFKTSGIRDWTRT